MTDIEQKTLELVNAAHEAGDAIPYKTVALARRYDPIAFDAVRLALEAHEADKSRHAAEMREQAERFSEAVRALCNQYSKASITRATIEQHLSPFIVAPVDPLVEALDEALFKSDHKDERAGELRKALDARGLAIVKKEAVNG